MHAETLLIEGPDTLAFAHAQFASNVEALAIDTWQFSAWLNAQGRVRALFHLARLDEQKLLLLLRGGSAATMCDALRRYVFRSRLSMQASQQALATGAELPLHAVRGKDHDIEFGCGTHSLRLVMDGAGDEAWRARQLPLGWPWLPTSTLETLLPPALSLHRMHAVAIDKGCYPGQEIVARLHWRGGHKRHLCHVRLSRNAMPGDILHRDGNEIGLLLDVVGTVNTTEALAVLSDEATSMMDASNTNTLLCNDALELRMLRRWEN